MLRQLKQRYRAPIHGAVASAVILLMVAQEVVGFHTPYKPEKSRHFDVTKSETFVPVTDKVFDLHYADGSHLKGFNGIDQVWVRFLNQFFWLHAQFGCCSSVITNAQLHLELLQIATARISMASMVF
uniref:Uncharacterized protein n=1 Tax=Cryptomonas curvata TaxID=233186 RepID=A0A7S0QUB1_9CRYP|mmetsp:Transcript_52789/g.110151  ORF Transcript_52789/g.110151 Transcript_52789/m.110151 type:complete len:127 (+) Transcript_52789:32-412(+)